MFNTVRAATSQFIFSSSQLNNIVRGKPSGIRFASGAKQPDSSAGKMDPNQGSESKTSRESSNMSSFGEGYATRSDEEGFGGTQQQQVPKHDDEEKSVHGRETEFDHTQGSEVKEKEKARNQKNGQQ